MSEQRTWHPGPDRQLAFGIEEIEGNLLDRFRYVMAQLPPDHLAWVDDGAQLTYGELDRASDTVASFLVEQTPALQGAWRQQVVALWMPHAAASAIGILGVLKAGHYYLPLEAVLGAAMMQHMLDDSPPSVMLTVRALYDSGIELLGPGRRCPVVCIDELPEAPAPELPPEAVPGSYSLTSIHYTSGSTGRPRGADRTHLRALHAARASWLNLEIGPDDQVAHLLSYVYGMANPAIYGSLFNGATVHALPVREVLPGLLYDWLAEHGITKLEMSVGILRSLAGLADTRPELPALRIANAGGEAVMRVDAERILRLMPAGAKLLTRLASTETGTMAVLASRRGNIPGTSDKLPAGYVPQDVEVSILDEKGQALPRGEVGQIAVRSRWLLRGYRNLPELTADKLLPDPDGGDRSIFLTGDMGRLAEDGLLEHLGRGDGMVKVRGYRVELGAIEAVLSTHPHVGECAVVARPGRDGNQRLLAYYVPRSQPTPSTNALREWLGRSLPDYMVPVRFVALEQLPRVGAHKIDRKSLPTPGRERPNLETPYVAPRSELEAALASIWTEVLDLDEVGADDDFAELGGDSLSALHMTLQVDEVLHLTVPSQWFRRPTLGNLSALLERASPVEDSPITHSPQTDRKQREEAGDDALEAMGRDLVIHRGPVIGRWALPYGWGVRLQRSMYRVPMVRRRLLRRHLAAFDSSVADAGLSDASGDLLTQHLMANTWRKWRLAALRTSEAFERHVVVEGREALRGAAAAGRGLIVVFVHQANAIPLSRRVLSSLGRERYYVLGNLPGTDEMTELERVMQITQRAYEELESGGVVFVSSDGRLGVVSQPISFYGRALPLRRGFADLALRSGAAVVALFGYAALDGTITLEFCELPTPTTDAETAPVVQQYADMMIQRWPRLLPSMPWARLAWLQNLPKAQ